MPAQIAACHTENAFATVVGQCDFAQKMPISRAAGLLWPGQRQIWLHCLQLAGAQFDAWSLVCSLPNRLGAAFQVKFRLQEPSAPAAETPRKAPGLHPELFDMFYRKPSPNASPNALPVGLANMQVIMTHDPTDDIAMEDCDVMWDATSQRLELIISDWLVAMPESVEPSPIGRLRARLLECQEAIRQVQASLKHDQQRRHVLESELLTAKTALAKLRAEVSATQSSPVQSTECATMETGRALNCYYISSKLLNKYRL